MTQNTFRGRPIDFWREAMLFAEKINCFKVAQRKK
jgi:hypothetical protein